MQPLMNQKMEANNNLERFFKFIDERHRIWYRRFILKTPRPWTTDPILQNYKFCNIYRELDRGTQYILEVIKQTEDYPLMLAKTITYRIVNNLPAIEYAGGMPSSVQEIPKFIAKLKEYKSKNGTLWFTAYRVLFPRLETDRDNFDRLERAMKEIYEGCQDNGHFIEDAKDLEEPQDFINYLNWYPAVGNFVAYEIYCDLAVAKKIPFTLDDYVNIGPGAINGLKLIYPDILTYTKAELTQLIAVLRDISPTYLPFDYPGKPLNLRDIEHSLCEFRKYHYIGLKSRRAKAKPFTPFEERQGNENQNCKALF